MRFEVHSSCADFDSYRAQRVKSIFNAESGAHFDLDIEGDLPDKWSIGAVIGPSGSGKTSLGRQLFGGGAIADLYGGWHSDRPLVDDISPNGSFDDVSATLAAVGLGDVPAWLRPFPVLSNGEQFRAGLARLILDGEGDCVVDEFTSVVDRQIAKVGCLAFQKSWRRQSSGRKVVVLSPHYGIIEWLQPDWVLDTGNKRMVSGGLPKRPEINLEICETDSKVWSLFKPHYYLDLPEPVAARHFVGLVDGEAACHVCFCPKFNCGHYRATRLVTMPEWQGAGVATRFLRWLCQYHLEGNGHGGKPYRTEFHTSHPGLIGWMEHSRDWVRVSRSLYGGNKAKSARSIAAASTARGRKPFGGGYGGHLRGVSGFVYVGGAK